jgi:uncharacterized protein YecE (DUF72 family)
MDFGKLPDVSGIDFRLPSDNPITTQTLSLSEKKTPKIFVGLPVWASKEWLGKIYPNSAKNHELLDFYTRQFNTIELNVTHYQIPTEDTIQKWKAASAEGFVFCPKFPQIISHDKQLQGVEGLTAEFCARVLELTPHLGMSFLQLAPYFSPRQTKLLEHFLNILPPDFPMAVEFRHPDWFQNTWAWEQTMQLLKTHGKTTVITDVAGRRDVVHVTLPIPKLALRWVGNEHPSDYTRIDDWVKRLKIWLAMGLEELYIFVHINDNHLAPELANYWITELNKHCGLNLTPPKFLPKVVQGTLF